MTKTVDDTDHRRRAAVRATEPEAGAMLRLRSSGKTPRKSVNHFVAAALIVAVAAPVPAALLVAAAASSAQEGGFGLPAEGTAVENAQAPESTFLEGTPSEEDALEQAAPDTIIAASEQTTPPAGMTTAPASEYTGGAEDTALNPPDDQYGELPHLAETGGLGPPIAVAALLAGAAILTGAIFASRSRQAACSDAPEGGGDDALPRA